MKVCKFCGSEFEKGSGSFCSRSCQGKWCANNCKKSSGYRSEFGRWKCTVCGFIAESRKKLFEHTKIHRLNKSVEEILYPAMEDFYLDIVIGGEGSSRNIRIDLPKFTLVGATTRVGDVSAPLRDRFGVLCDMQYYTEEQLIRRCGRNLRLLVC